jgi:large conductance mechanosensitive channel
MSLMKEFKEFALKGNMVDLAIGIIIGAAFSTIVTSLVEDVIMPPIGKLIGGADFSNLFIPLDEKTRGVTSLEEAKKAGAVIAYGNFLQNCINFLIIAIVVFMIVKAINRFRRKEAVAPEVPPAPTREETILIEIRDLLKTNSLPKLS